MKTTELASNFGWSVVGNGGGFECFAKSIGGLCAEITDGESPNYPEITYDECVLTIRDDRTGQSIISVNFNDLPSAIQWFNPAKITDMREA